MLERDSHIHAIVDGASNRSFPQADQNQGVNQLRKGRLIKSFWQTGSATRLLLLIVVLTAVFALLSCSRTSESNSQVSPANVAGSASELATFLKGKLPGTRIISTRADGRIDRSFILTVRDSDEDTLRKLPRVSDYADQWRGTVLCEWLVDWQPAELFLEEWGEYGLALPPCVFFGDKELLAQIKEALK